MNILEARVDWRLAWDSNPDLILRVNPEEIPTIADMIYEKRRSRDGAWDVYYGVRNGYVDFYVAKAGGKPDRGYGGRAFVFKLVDGTEDYVVGPWTSNSASVVAEGFPDCMEVIFQLDEAGYDLVAGAMLVEDIKNILSTVVEQPAYLVEIVEAGLRRNVISLVPDAVIKPVGLPNSPIAFARRVPSARNPELYSWHLEIIPEDEYPDNVRACKDKFAKEWLFQYNRRHVVPTVASKGLR